MVVEPPVDKSVATITSVAKRAVANVPAVIEPASIATAFTKLALKLPICAAVIEASFIKA